MVESAGLSLTDIRSTIIFMQFCDAGILGRIGGA